MKNIDQSLNTISDEITGKITDKKLDKKSAKKTDQKVIVITGASSGNGKAAALEFAKNGHLLVLAARNLRNLQAVADQCLETGTEAMVIQTDVTDPDQVRSLARGAIDHFGHIDVWISNAGVGAVGAFNQTPLAAHHQVIHTNLFGAINSAYAIMPYFKKRKRGTFIVTNSVGAWIPLPNASSYSASKFGLRGFVEALQAEVSDEPDIHICEVAPAFVKTPGIFHVGNYVGKKLKNPPGAGSAERVGKSMLNLINHPHDRNAVMALTYVGRAGYFLFPKFTRWVSAKLFKAYFSQAEAAPRTDGALYSTQRAGR